MLGSYSSVNETLRGLAVSISMENILSSDRLPSLPEVAVRVVEIARQPDPDFVELVETIRMDPAIAGRVLKMANSALLGMRTRASSIETAVPRLGTTMVRALVLGFCLAESQPCRSLNLRPWYQRLWRDSLMQAAAAEALAESQHGRVDHCNWFLAGLLQDIGRLAMLSVCQDDYIDHVLSVTDGRTQVELELNHFGFTHVDVGVALCQRWNLEESMIQAIACHHHPAHLAVPLRFTSSTLLTAGLITAAHIAEYLGDVSSNLGCSRRSFERMLLQVFAMRPNEVYRLLADIDARAGEIASAFSVDIGVMRSLESILGDAQEVLSQIAVNGQMRLVNAHIPSESAENNTVGRRSAAVTTPISVEDQRWFDLSGDCFSRTWLDHSLPTLLGQAHADQLPLGLLLIGMDARDIGTEPDDSPSRKSLKRVASLLKNSVRVSDSVVRYSEWEFLLLLTDINLDMLHLLTDQIRQRLKRDFTGDPRDLPETAFPIGAVILQPSKSAPPAMIKLLSEVESSLQETRRHGGKLKELTTFEDGRARRVQFTLLRHFQEPIESPVATER